MDDAHHGLGQTPLPVDVGDGPPCAEHHDPLHGGGEEEEGEGDADCRVDDAEGLPAIGQGCRVTISWRNVNEPKTIRKETGNFFSCNNKNLGQYFSQHLLLHPSSSPAMIVLLPVQIMKY